MKKMSIFLAFMILVSFMVLCVPTVSYATDGFGDDVLKLEMGTDGQISISGDDFARDRTNAWNTLFRKYKGFIAGVSGIATITMIGVFILNFIKLATSSTNPQARNQALIGILWSGIAAAGLGSVTVIVGFFIRAL